MTERVPSDHPSVDTYRARLARSGSTRRPCLRVPEEADLRADEILRLILDGTEYHARVQSGGSSDLVITGAYHNRRLAREDGSEGENHLLAWFDANDLDIGDSLEFDEIDPGDVYGLRVPGKRAVYEVARGPDDSLAAIADELQRE